MIHHVTLGYTMLCYAMAHKPHLSQIAVAVLWWMPPPLPPFSGGAHETMIAALLCSHRIHPHWL